MAESLLVNINTSQDANKAFKSEVALRMNEVKGLLKLERRLRLYTSADFRKLSADTENRRLTHSSKMREGKKWFICIFSPPPHKK